MLGGNIILLDIILVYLELPTFDVKFIPQISKLFFLDIDLSVKPVIHQGCKFTPTLLAGRVLLDRFSLFIKVENGDIFSLSIKVENDDIFNCLEGFLIGYFLSKTIRVYLNFGYNIYPK
jgi:hypothetical protein